MEIKYTLNDKEEKSAETFIKEHRKCWDDYYSDGRREIAPPGAVSYIISSCSMFKSLSIRCDQCKVIEDITDIDNL